MVTLGQDLSSFYHGISLSVSGAATAFFAVDQTFLHLTLAGNGTISVGSPPPAGGGGTTGTTSGGDSGGPVTTPTPTPTPTGTSSQPRVLTATAGGYARDGSYATTDLSADPTLVVKKGLAG